LDHALVDVAADPAPAKFLSNRRSCARAEEAVKDEVAWLRRALQNIFKQKFWFLRGVFASLSSHWIYDRDFPHITQVFFLTLLVKVLSVQSTQPLILSQFLVPSPQGLLPRLLNRDTNRTESLELALAVPKDAVMKNIKCLGASPILVCVIPDKLVLKTFWTKNFIEEAAQPVTLGFITMKEKTSRLGQCFLEQHQPLVHELEAVVVRPDVGVLDLLAEGVALAVELRRALRPTQTHLPHVVGAGVERRVNVDQVHFAPEAVRQEMRQHFLVVAVEQKAAFRIGGRPVLPDLRVL